MAVVKFLILFLFLGPSSLALVGLNGQKENIVREEYTASTKTIQINGVTVFLDLALTAEQRSKGLSGRRNLEPDKGMLFYFDKPGIYSFWMKDMNFPIDIIWIGEDLRVADVTENASPESFPKQFLPKEAAKFVLEVNAGWAKEHGIKEKMPVKIF